MFQLYLLCFSSLNPSLAVLAIFNICTYTFGYDRASCGQMNQRANVLMIHVDATKCTTYDSNFSKVLLKLAPNKIIFNLAHDLSFLYPTQKEKSSLLHSIIHSFC